MNDEHKMDLIIKKKKENYYVKEDAYEHITPEKVLIIAEKYIDEKKLKEERYKTYEEINDRLQPLHLFKKKDDKYKWID